LDFGLEFMVTNVHERLIHAPLEAVGGLIDGLASRDDVMWPGDRWPPLRFDRPVGVGAVGGHGPVRYTVEAYEPGRSVRCRFTEPRGFVGTHGFEAEELGAGVVRLRHTLSMRVEGWARVSWPLAFRWLHDALIEDALDRAESWCESRQTPARPRRWSLWVRLLRSAARRLMTRSRAAKGTLVQSGKERPVSR
jgi:hypothetical protein